MASSKNYDWDGIAFAYYSDMPLEELCKKFDIRRHAFYYYTDRMGWPRKTRADPEECVSFQRKHMVKHAHTILTRKIVAAASRMKNAEELNTLEAHREANTIQTLTRVLDQLMQFEKKIREEETQTTGATNDTAEHLRSSLTERLARLETEPD